MQFNTKLFEFVPNCDYPDHFSWTVASDPGPPDKRADSFHQVSSSSDLFGIQTENLWNRGTYLVTQTLTKTGYASAYGISKKVTTFKVRLGDPCEQSKLLPSIGVVNFYAVIGKGSRFFQL